MKKNFLLVLSLILLILSSNILIQAQSNTIAKQVIIANGGKFETAPPYSDYVTVESYDLTTMDVTVFNTIYTQSVQDILINNHYAYITAQDSIVLYNIDTYQRIAAVKDSGINQMALNHNQLIVTKQYPIKRFRVEVLDANTLGLLAFVDGIPGDCEGVNIYGGYAYVAMDSGYAGSQGRLAVIDTSTWTVDTIVNFGPSGIGIYSVYQYGGYIYTVNVTPYGAGNIGSITKFNPGNYSFTTNTFGLALGPGYGIDGNLLYLGVTSGTGGGERSGIGAYNLDTQIMQDTDIIHFTGQTGSVEIHSVGLDFVNKKFYTNLGNRTSFGIGVVFSFTGDSLTSYSDGINPDACAVDFRTPTGIIGQGRIMDDISIYPNPADDFININLNSPATSEVIKILDLTGRVIETRQVQKNENRIRMDIATCSSGVYLISFTSDEGTKVRKFVKR
jgi:hypothetical protein